MDCATMHISPAMPDGFDLDGKLGRAPVSSLPREAGGLNLVSYPTERLGRGLVDRALRVAAGVIGTIRFGKLFKLSLLAMMAAGTSHALLSLTGWLIFGRLYGVSVAVALVFSLGAALTEFLRDKGEDGDAAAGEPGNNPDRLLKLG